MEPRARSEVVVEHGADEIELCSPELDVEARVPPVYVVGARVEPTVGEDPTPQDQAVCGGAAKPQLTEHGKCGDVGFHGVAQDRFALGRAREVPQSAADPQVQAVVIARCARLRRTRPGDQRGCGGGSNASRVESG